MIDAADIRPEDLPASLRWVLDAIGLENTLNFVSLYGGGRAWIARRYGIGHPLVALIGLPAAAQLAAAAKESGRMNTMIKVPLLRSARIRIRNRRIMEMREQRLSCQAIAVEMDLSGSTVSRVLSAIK